MRRGFLEFVHLTAIAIWVGSLVFFSFVAAPSLFSTLSPEAAGDAVGGMIPLYSRLGVICGAVGALSALALARARGDQGVTSWRRISALVLTLMVVLTLYGSEVVAPRVAAARARMHDPDLVEAERAGHRQEFARAHRLSATLNGAILLLGGALLVVKAGQVSRADGRR